MTDHTYYLCPTCDTLYTEQHRCCPSCTRSLHEEPAESDHSARRTARRRNAFAKPAVVCLRLAFVAMVGGFMLGFTPAFALIYAAWGIAAALVVASMALGRRE